MEEKRQQIKLAELKLQYIQNQENRDFQAQQAELNHQRQKELQEYIQSVNLAIHKSNIEFQRWRFEQEKSLETELAQYNRETQLAIAEYQRETAIKVAHNQAEVQKIFANWPLTLPPAQILESYSHNSLIPLRVFIAPPKVKFERFVEKPQNFPDIELTLNQQLRDFFDYYSQQGRPIEFLAGAWESKRFHSEASIKALFGMLKSEPTLILESEFDGGYLNFRIAYWTIGQPKYSYQTIIARLSYREILYNSAKTRALTWKNTKDKLIALGKTQAEIEKRGGDNEINLKIWEEEQSLREAGIEDNELEIHYKINRKHFEDLYQFLITCHCLVAGWIADTHHLFLHDLTPLLPQLLPDLTQNIPEGEVTDEVVGVVISGYEQIYQALAVERSHWVPELILKLAQGLVNFPNQSWAKTQLLNSVEYWLKLRNSVSQRNRVSEESELWDAVNSVVTAQDLDYIENVNNLLAILGETHRVNIVQTCYKRGQNHCQKGEYSTAIDDFTQVLLLETNSPDANYNRGLAYSKLGQYQSAIEDYNQSLQLNPNYAEAYNNRGNAYYKLGEYEKAITDYNSCLALNPNLPGVAHNRDVVQGVWDEKCRQEQMETEIKRQEEEEKHLQEREFKFDVITVNVLGKETKLEHCRAEFFKEDLGNNISLEMVSIPGGTFMMGSPEDDTEKPIHPVNIAAFSMAKYPITQAQWQAIMGNNPSSFKGANRPVECVTWYQAQEFCQRLSQKTGKTYRLPSEAEWEYACRAGTTTPFHFGETITVDLANYDANDSYASAPTGTYRQQTTDVGSFPPNAFGLYDMHGNVWEWCADPWRSNYNGAPRDGSVWQLCGNTQNRVLRGGSWYTHPRECRSANRCGIKSNAGLSNFGFRVVSLPPAWIL
ncbi:Formylglycine-generating enzyme [Planktothrix tepida]|uniref:Sulfatase-modifying factor enzyme-like domain-containing protein n=1 Tax=Planktothrix tepida PCC 9214 TaxID=671072 RepID=A0A1J1LHS3_9CYAN|nr:Formylglycine-generating enzyme [Planktothrix tepida]CUR31436.1 conserved hypothetical protein [Planktothrix tepida PCC 9214]